MVRPMPEWKPEQPQIMNKRVHETLSRLECAQETSKNYFPVYLLAVKDTYTLMIKDRVAYKDITRTDLKNVSKLACKMKINLFVDIHQPLDIGNIDIELRPELINDGIIKLKNLRKVL